MRHSLKSNYIYNLLYQMLLMLLPFVTTPYVSRVLSPGGIGAVNYTSSVVSIAVLAAALGSGLYAQKEIAFAAENLEKRSRVFWCVFWIRVTASVMVFIPYAFLIYFSVDYRGLYIIQLITILANMIDIVWLFQGMEDFKKTSLRSIIVKLSSVAAVFLFVKNQDDLIIYAFINSLSIFVNALIMWAYLPGAIQWTKVSRRELRHHIKPILVLFVPMAAIYVYTYVDKIILRMLSTEEQVGFYSQAERIVKLSMTVITSLANVMLPRIANLIREKQWEKVTLDIRNAIHFVFFLGFPMAAGMAVIAPLFVPWFFGAGYEQCISLIQYLSVLIIIISLSSVTGQAALLPLNKQGTYTFSIIAGALTNVVLNVIFIPKYEAVGAVMGTVAAECVVEIIQWCTVSKSMKLSASEIVRDNIKPFAGAGVMTTVLILIRPFFPETMISTVAFGVIGVIVFFLCMCILRDNFVQVVRRQIVNLLTSGRERVGK